MSDQLPSAPQPAQWAINLAQAVTPIDSPKIVIMWAARKIESASPVAELTAANAELLAALNNICNCISETRGADAYYHVETARALIAKHSPTKK